jgi:hypothetical protein
MKDIVWFIISVFALYIVFAINKTGKYWELSVSLIFVLQIILVILVLLM